MSVTEPPRRFAAQLGVLVAAMSLTSVLVEFLFRTPDMPVGKWLVTFPVAVGFNALVLSLVAMTLFALIGRAITAALVTLTLYLIVGFAHASTLATLGRPLFPWDLLLFREAADVLPFVTARYGVAPLVLGAVVLALALVASVRFGPRTLPWRHRAALLVVPVAVGVWLSPQPSTKLQPLKVRHLYWVQAENYRENGLALTFLMNLPAANVKRPASYSRDRVEAALSARTPTTLTDVQPDVIVIMSESFFDVTRLPGVTFERDPLPTLHRLQRDGAAGTLYPPVFGGGTANTEFEFLTGHSMRFLPPGSVPYQQYLRKKQRSLASIFAAEGYRTEAAHIYHRWFWERDQVYERLGFQRFTSMEQVDLSERKTWYPSDALLTKEIVKALEADTAPLFMFGVGVEGHGPYEPNRYPQAEVRFDGPLDDAARAELTTYAEAVSHADRELGMLIEYLEKRGRPAVLVFFGDHLPSLPQTLRQTGVAESIERIPRLELSRRAFLYEVPLVVWSNVKPGPRALGSMSSSFLGPLVLDETGTKGTPYMDFLREVRRQLPVLSPNLVSDADGAWHETLPAELRALEDAWWTLEYDALFGDDFAAPAPTEG